MGKIDENVFDAVMEDIAERGLSMVKACAAHGVHKGCMWRFIEENDERRAKYARARAQQADLFGEKVSEIAAGVLSGEIDYNAARVAIDGYKWTAGKMKPKRWGDRVDHNVNGEIHVKRMLLNDEVDSPKALPQVIDVEAKESND